MLKKVRHLIVIGLTACLAAACSSDEQNAKIEVWLTDAPGDYQEVNVEIIGVEVHVGDEETSSGWRSLDVDGGVYNLLELTNGLDTLLGELELPGGKISQLRLKLGDDNSIKVGDEVHDLTTPSAQQSGLKLQINQVLQEGITYKILLDFDVARSIVHTGSDKYILKPVIRTITEATDGAIKGIVVPKESTPAIYAIMGTDTLATTFSDSTGGFLIRGLDAGTYTVSIEPDSTYVGLQKTDVSVSLGVVTDLGTIEVVEKE